MKRNSQRRTVLSLFTGAGGLDLGLEAAGFEHVLCVDIDADARQTLIKNRPNWKLADQGDIHLLESRSLMKQANLRPRQLALLAGGPPCQPFSKSAFWHSGDVLRLRDPRAKTLEAYLRVVETTLPQVLMLENVKGLAYSGKDEGLTLLKKGLERINLKHRTKYLPQVITINSVDYGVPQVRERVFLLANINGKRIEIPKTTHGLNPGQEVYRTAWDAIGHLDTSRWADDLDIKGRWADLLPSIPEGKNYLWHTPRNKGDGSQPLFGWRTRYWSFLLKLAKNQPSWTIQAGPGPATGPFHWRNRLLSIQELCQLQTFPDGYEIVGSIRSVRRQIGNAVPCAIGELLGLEIRRQVFDDNVRRGLRLIPPQRNGCPPPSRPCSVPRKYLPLKGRHAEHPGTGLGPGARQRHIEQVIA